MLTAFHVAPALKLPLTYGSCHSTLERVFARSVRTFLQTRTTAIGSLDEMDPKSARLAVQLQLQDADDVLKTLQSSNQTGADSSEMIAFKALRSELLKKRSEINGQLFALNILREENFNRVAFTRLITEERQAERKLPLSFQTIGYTKQVQGTMTWPASSLECLCLNDKCNHMQVIEEPINKLIASEMTSMGPSIGPTSSKST